jgi:hypothetical protein
MKKTIATLCAALALTACGGGGGDDKSVFGLWTRDGDNATLDLRGASFGQDWTISLFLRDATNCLCTMTVIGDESKGSYVLGRCISNPFNAAVNRQCQALNQTGNYTNTGNVLTLVGPNGAATYR